MKATHSTAFLCGCFSIKEKNSANLLSTEWTLIEKKAEERALLQKFYYPEFVDFCFKEKNSPKRGITRYVFPKNEKITLALPKNKSQEIIVKNIELYLLPYNLLIYAIQIDLDGADLDDITLTLSVLRNITDYKEELLSTWGKIVDPIVEVYKLLAQDPKTSESDGSVRYSDLMENGNKLKIFQIVEVESEGMSEEQQKKLLFELGTLAPINSYDANSSSSPSSDYFNKIMKENKISIFNNWKALSLFDTFTFLSQPAPAYIRENWVSAYFSMIYIHALFLKFYLFRMNILFRKRKTDAARLEEEFAEFECNCCFHKISYNFLPLEIYEGLDVGLEINEEKNQLYRLIEQEKNIQEKKGDQRMNSLLFILTCMTVFSTIWDFCCLLDQIQPYEQSLGSSVLGYRVAASTILLILLIFIIFNNKFKK
jgi:hypothetical protein